MSDRTLTPYQRRSGASTRALSRKSAPKPVTIEQLEDEAGFQGWVTGRAEVAGWTWWHDNDARRNKRGFPDLVMARGNRLIFAELKTMTGSLSREQREWRAQLTSIAEASGGAVAYHVWRPSDRADIERVLA